MAYDSDSASCGGGFVEVSAYNKGGYRDLSPILFS